MGEVWLGIYLGFDFRAGEMENIPEEETGASPLTPRRRAAMMSNIFISFLTYIYDLNSLDNFLWDSPSFRLVFPVFWSSLYPAMGMPLAATVP